MPNEKKETITTAVSRPKASAKTVGQKMEVLKKMLGAKDTLRKATEVLPHHLRAETIARDVLMVVGQNEKLQPHKCDPLTVVQCMADCSQLGLRPGPFGHIYLVPFFNKKKQMNDATIIIGYKGLIDLAVRRGKVESVESRLVLEDDEFDMMWGTSPNIMHRPTKQREGDVIGAYCVVHYKARPQFDYMDLADLERIRKSAPGGKKQIWMPEEQGGHRREMQRKTIARRTCKYVAVSADFMEAMLVEDRQFTGQRRQIEAGGSGLMIPENLPGSITIEGDADAEVKFTTDDGIPCPECKEDGPHAEDCSLQGESQESIRQMFDNAKESQ